MSNFKGFPKISRLMRDIIVTEKIDGSNAQIQILDNLIDEDPDNPEVPQHIIATSEDGRWSMRAGSRTRWITPGKSTDNYGFAGWALANQEELFRLGHGTHFGEWWGQGINRNYSQTRKWFSLFNTSWWNQPDRPLCCKVVPVLYDGPFDMNRVHGVMHELTKFGSYAAPGFMKPEGIVVFHTAGGAMFKRTIEGDDVWKGKSN